MRCPGTPRFACRLILTVACAAAAVHVARATQLASRPTAEWIKLLDSPERVAALQVDEIVGKLQLQDGLVVADIGAGTGVFSLPMARHVGPTGRVYAVEVDRGLVDYIREKAGGQKLKNVQAVLGRFEDPMLPVKDVDLAFFHDALHHIANRAGYLRRLADYMKPAARIAVVDLDPVKGAHSNDRDLQVTKAQVAAWMKAIGFEAREQADLSEQKWFAVYTRSQ
jgi:ubiquinone/menaquinone biosynthesis C-methylase UbiE